MPSNSDPKSNVNSGPGKLSVGVVPSSALLFPSGGGSGAALEAHILNPHDAHMSGAIGIPPYDPVNGDPLLASAGGPIDGESVLDFIDQFKDLLPTPPNYLGTSAAPNSGVPNWGAINPANTAGFTRAGALQPSHYVLANGISAFTLGTVLYPADRGVLALYKNTDGQFTGGATTLVAALWLGPDPVPVGFLPTYTVPSANWNPALKSTLQPNYTGAGTGLDLFNMTFRYPAQVNFAVAPWTGSPYANYPQTFASFQIATLALQSQALASGDTGSFILVQWRETFATTAAAISPTNLITNLTSINCYSTVPVGSVASGAFDTGAPATINRRNVFIDAASGTAPTGNTWTSSPVGSPTTVILSGVSFYNNGSNLTFSVNVEANHLFTNSYETSTVGGDLPSGYTGFTSANDPMLLQFNQFGGGTLPLSYLHLRKHGNVTNYTAVAPPAIGDIGEYNNTTLAIVSPSAYTQAGGISLLQANLYSPFFGAQVFADTTQYLFDSEGNQSTTVKDIFVDEEYRCSLSGIVTTNPAQPVIPTGGTIYSSSTVLAANESNPNLQVIGGQLVYPHYDFTQAAIKPTQAGSPNYATVLSGDTANTMRRYIRMFDTGLARNSGHLTIVGLPQTAFYTSGAYTGSEVADHPNGAIVQIKLPGQTGWCDLGQPSGTPDSNLTLDFRGVLSSYPPANNGGGSYTWAYSTGSFSTQNNGSGNFLLIVRITLIKNGTGQNLALSSVTWSA